MPYIYSNLQKDRKDRKEDIYRDLRGFYSSIFLLLAICYVYIYTYTYYVNLCKISPIQLGKPWAWVVIPEIDRARGITTQLKGVPPLTVSI